MTPRSRARIERLVNEALVSLSMAALAFTNAKDASADPAETENFNTASAGITSALRGIREEIERT